MRREARRVLLARAALPPDAADADLEAAARRLGMPDDEATALLHPADDFTFRIASEIPLVGGLGSSAAAIVAGLMAADHLFELDADVLSIGRALARIGEDRR